MKKIISTAIALALVLCLGTTAFAASSQSPYDADIDGQGYISNDDGDTNVMVDITVPGGSFVWYADQNTKNIPNSNYDIVSGTYMIENNSETVNLQVEILGYVAGAATSNPVTESKVRLNLTGDLAAKGFGQNLFNHTSGTAPTFGVYDNLLASQNGDGIVGNSTWAFGFDGYYDDSTLPTNVELSNYIIKLQFTASSISA